MTGFAHRPERPTWRCRADGDGWPCHIARKVLAETFPGSGDELSHNMAQLQLMAAEDLGVPDPASLYQRFVRWTEPPSVTCGRCERGKHRAIPGLPPRLFPCQLQSR
jgi:hypothetical protein